MATFKFMDFDSISCQWINFRLLKTWFNFNPTQRTRFVYVAAVTVDCENLFFTANSCKCSHFAWFSDLLCLRTSCTCIFNLQLAFTQMVTPNVKDP